MLKKHLKCALIGGFIIFVWGLFSWMVFPWHQRCLKKFTNETEVAKVITNNAPKSGVYILPNTFSYDEGTSHQEMATGVEMIERGPFVFASIQTHGIGKASLKPFIIALIIQIMGAFFVTWMLLKAKNLAFKKQVGFVTGFGLSVGVLGQFPEWNWWGFPYEYVLINVLDLTIGWFLAGLAIAKILKK